MEQRLAEFDVPIVVGVPVGHDPDNEPWVYGQVGELLLTADDDTWNDQAPLHDEDLAADAAE